MAVPNPYFIHIELLWPNGTRPTQNEIARVRAFDVNGAAVTSEGESGFNPNTGGWYPVYMQNIAAFFPPREKPNLRFQVWNTAEQLVHTTQVFNNIPSASTVRITIGVGAELVGGSGSTWLVSGTVRHQDSTLLTSGSVRAYDITNGSEKQLGSTSLDSGGTYSVSYTTADFTSNGGSHAQPNLTVRVYNSSNQFLGQAGPVVASSNQVLDITVPNGTGPNPGTRRRVFGDVQNPVGLPVAGILVEAYHLAWTIQGLQELPLGATTPPTASNGSGAYEILYDPPSIGTPGNPCGTPAGQINLIVYAKEPDGASLVTLFTSPVFFDAPAQQRVDLTVNKTSVSTDSEYKRIDEALTPCLGDTEAGKWATLNKLNERPEYLSFVAQTTGFEEVLVRAYVRAWLIAGEINSKVPGTLLSRPMSPEVIYALLRILEAASLADLLNVSPEAFFDTLVRAVHVGIVSASVEVALYPSAAFGNKSLLDDWRLVLAKLMNQTGLSWQAQLLHLVFADVTLFPEVLASSGTPFAATATTHNVPMPAGVVAGDLLIALFVNTGAASVTAPAPAGWTQLWSTQNGSTNPVRFSGFAKRATASEPANVNFTTSANAQAAAHMYRIAKGSWSGGDLSQLSENIAVALQAASGAGTSLNLPQLNPSGWSIAKTLWLACAGHSAAPALTSTPAGYTPTPALRTPSSSSAGNCTVLSTRRANAVSSEAPAPFMLASAANWLAVTVAIREGTVSLATKREAVVNEYFNHQGSFAELVEALRASGQIDEGEAEDLIFVFEMYERVGRYYPIVASVHAHKSAQGWHTIRDLATVPLDGAGSNTWVMYASQSQNFSSGTFPADVPGNNSNEKAHVYAARLYELFRETGPEQKFASDLAASAGSDPVTQGVATFLTETEDFDLERTNVDQYAASHPNELSAEEVERLKQLQRVYRLTPDLAAVNELIEDGLDSAVKIARYDEGQFIALYEDRVGGLTAARNIHRTASHYSSEVLFTLVKFNQNLNEVGGMSAVPGAVNLAVLDPTHGLLPSGAVTGGGKDDVRKFPNWITLFGSLNQCACKHCQTVLSPGAYLVDLLEFVAGAPKNTLFARRPDLEDIELTCTNTNTVLPYIDLVNEVLETVVEPLRFTLSLTPNVVNVLDDAAAGIPSEVAKVRAAFATATAVKQSFLLGERAMVKKGAADAPPGNPSYREWVVEDDAWRFSIRPTGASYIVYPSQQTSEKNDSLEVFPEHFNERAYARLAQQVFPFNLPLELGREETDVFLRAKSVAHSLVVESFDVRPWSQKLGDPRLARAYLRLTENEANAIVAVGRPLHHYFGFTNENETIPRPDKPTLTVSGSWVSLMALVPVFLHRSGLSYLELLELLDTEFVHRFATDAHGLHVAAPNAALAECNINDFQIAHLSAEALQRISFFIRLWRQLGWSMRDVDRYLLELQDGELLLPAASPNSNVDETFVRLYQLRRLAGELRLTPRAAVALFRPMDTRRTERNPKSLFDDVFLDGSPSQPEILALELVARGEALHLNTLAADTDVRAHVRAALRLKAEDLDLLWDTFVGTGADPTLDVVKLTNVYRGATLAAAFEISVGELFDLQDLIGGSLLAPGSVSVPVLGQAIRATLAAVRELRLAQSARMSAAEMRYYLTHAHEVDDPFTPLAQDMEAAAQRLAASASEIAAANPAQDNPDAALLSTALAKVMPADKVVRALRIIEAPDDTDTAQLELVARYFSAFVPAPAAFLAALEPLPANPPLNLTEEGRVAARYRYTFELLHVQLLEQARTTAAINVAAELTRTDAATANTLLTERLHSVSTPTAPALDDWKAMLKGGWDSGEATLVEAGPGDRQSTFIANQAGDHRFVASVKATAGVPDALTFELDGQELVVESATVRDGRTDVVFGPVALRAGSAHPVRFLYEDLGNPDATVTLLFRVGNDDMRVLPSTAVMAFNANAYVKAFKAVRLTQGLALTKPELRHLIENPSVFDLDALPFASGGGPVPWSALSQLIELLGLNRSVRLKQGTLLEFFRDTVPGFAGLPGSEVLDAVSAQTGWKVADIETALSLWTTPPPWSDPALWLVLREVFAVVRRLDIRASQILELLVANTPTIGSATTLRNVFRAQFSKDSWKEIFKPLRDPLRQRQRDALVGYLTTRPLPVGPNGTPQSFFDANDLFSFFLIDVEMEPDTVISRIKLALNVVQLFVQRVFLGLEDASSLGELEKKKDQWAWMERYRVWEANRKVFLYPENWIEPELRDDKTEFFTELEDELSQGPLTHDTALQALTGYLEKMTEVSNLEVVGAFAEGTPGDGPNYYLHIIGRTRFRSRGLFYRTFQGRQAHDGTFSPWKRINLEIDADVITPVVVNGRLHLIWPRVVTKEKPNEHEIGSEGAVTGENQNAFDTEKRVQYQAEIRLMWSEYVAKKNKWTKAKLSKSRGIDENAPTPFNREIGEDQARTENYHLRVESSSELLSIHLIRTDVPVASGYLNPKRLGTFQLWHSGDDTYVTHGDQPWALGSNWPLGTVLKHNAAFETEAVINNTVASDRLQFSGSFPFLGSTPGAYRIFATNLGFLGEENQPFFYETLTKSLFSVNQGREAITGLSDQTTLAARFSTFHHPLVKTFEEKLHQFGPAGLMHRLTEALPAADDRYYANYYYNYYYGSLYLGYHIAGDTRALYTTQRMFEEEHAPGPHSVKPLYPLPTVEFGYGTSFGIYNWELFFHLPMLIAGRLSQDLKFEDALNWYHHVFDPKQELNRYEQTQRWVDDLPPGARYWTFLPFFANKKTTDSLLATLGLTKSLTAYEHDDLTKLIDDWRRDPFKPHLIARQRLAAYQKFVVMKYLDNLIAWADQLFRQDTFETINEATQLYILADELLGGRPEQVAPLTGSPRYTYRELQAKGIDEFSNAIVEVESHLVGNRPHLKTTQIPPLGSSMTPIQKMALTSFYFRIPRNERLDRYWDTVEDRLFKIRNSMNIDGVKRRLALFEPPIDPALLVRAAAAGLDLGSVLAQLNAPLPCYRFNVWIQKSTELCKELQSFGAALLSALEKRDAEELQLLRQGHEIRMLELVRRVRQQQIKEAEENIRALELSRALAEERHEFYRTRAKISGGERVQIDLTLASTVMEVGQGILHATAGLFGAVPDSIFGMVGPFPTGLAQVKIGTAGTTIASHAASALGVAASLTRGLSNVAGLNAAHERRWDDWKLQERLAQKEITQLDQQIAIAMIRLDISEKELENHEQQLEHAQEMREFLQDKFTNRDLYQWMVSQLTRTYNQVYKLAFEAARTAERTFEFELGTSLAGFIQFDYVDSLRQGLLAGEKLIHDIKRMDVAYLERNKRELEIQKPISLANFDGRALQQLREAGSCEFELPEVLFDLDFPGQYFRRIKGVRLTIPCVTGPHTSVSAKLSLLGSAYRKESAPGPSYAYQGFDDPRFVHDPIGITSIATSRAQGDPGLFELNFRDERYLPFEGGGAVSRWRLELPGTYRQFDYHTISDVVLDLSYTARDGGGLLKLGAEGAIVAGLNSIRELAVEGAAAATGLVRAFSLKREFPDVFHRLLAENSAAMTLTKEHFPFVVRQARLSMAVVGETSGAPNPIDVHVIPKLGMTLPSGAALGLNEAEPVDINVPDGAVVGIGQLSKAEPELLATPTETWRLVQSGLPAASVDDIVLIVNYAVTAPAAP